MRRARPRGSPDSIGPLGVRIEPWGRTGTDEAEAAFREQAAALAEGGVDLFILETFRDLNEIKAAIRAVRAVSDKPIVAQMTTGDDSNSLDGTPPQTFTPEIERAGADVIGVNCSVGPAAMLETIETMSRLTGARLSAQPNAGRPRDVDGRNLYLSSPDYIASYARRFIAAGVRLVGGCCGTTPDHVRQIALAVRTMAPAAARAGGHRRACPATRRPRPRSWIAARSRRSPARSPIGEFAIVAEVSAPRGLDLASAVRRARLFQELGALAVNVPGLSEVRRSRERAGARLTYRAAGQGADAAALLVPRSQPDRDAVRSRRGARARPARRPAHDRQSGAARHLRGRDVGVRRRRDRPREHGRAAQPRPRHRRPVDRHAHAVSYRGGDQSLRAQRGQRMAPARAQDRTPARSSS